MEPPTPFFREIGSGPGVVCLHANASSSTQWRALMETLAPEFHVLAPDSYGAGKGPAYPTDRTISLQDEAALHESVFTHAGNPFAVVAHSYGAAVALVTAVSQPERIHALALYEPTLFAVLDAESPPPNEADGIRETVAEATAEFDASNPAGAAKCFIDYWMGAGAWDHMPESRQAPIVASIGNLRGWAKALLNEPTPLAAFTRLNISVLYMIGKDSPVSSRGVARLLTKALPQVEVVEFEGLGHMGPVTHTDVVNQAIYRFLKQQI